MEVNAVRYLWLWLLLPLLTACGVGQDFPEDRWVEGPWTITNEWRTLIFSEPLEIDDEGWQNLYLVVDGDQFKRRNLDLKQDMTEKEIAQIPLLKHRTQEWLLDPEVVAISQDGAEFELKPGNQFESHGTSTRVATGYSESGGFYNPPWPDSTDSIRAIRIRSDHPFTVEAIRWHMDQHPDQINCGGPCPGWLTTLDKTLYQIESWFGMHDESSQEG